MTPRGAVACDVDGVVWLAGEAIPGAAEGVSLLESEGFAVWFVTNNSSDTHASLRRRFRSVGIDPSDRLVTSADAAASMVEPGASVLVGGEEGVMDALLDRGCRPVQVGTSRHGEGSGGYDAVVVGIHRSFDYAGLAELSRHIRGGARFIATNDDPTYPTPQGVLPGGGSIVAAVASASGREPEFAGKPHQAMARVLQGRLNGSSPLWMIGDRESTDGRFAGRLGARFAHVSSAVGETGGVGSSASVASLLEAAQVIVTAR